MKSKTEKFSGKTSSQNRFRGVAWRGRKVFAKTLVGSCEIGFPIIDEYRVYDFNMKARLDSFSDAKRTIPIRVLTVKDSALAVAAWTTAPFRAGSSVIDERRREKGSRLRNQR